MKNLAEFVGQVPTAIVGAEPESGVVAFKFPAGGLIFHHDQD